jgi:hypothetical protein
MDALRRRFRGGPVAVLRRLGMDESDLAPPDDNEPGDAVTQLLDQFGALSDEDKTAFINAISQMADNNGETAGDRERSRYAQDRGLPYRNARQAAAIGSFAARFPHAMKISNGFG